MTAHHVLKFSPELVRARRAFEHLRPAGEDFATAPIATAFNWSECFAFAREGDWYLVVFRSTRTGPEDDGSLISHDEAAYVEALGGQGLIHYFRGGLGKSNECISLCLWESADDARAPGQQPAHLDAVALAGQVYEAFRLERYAVHLNADGTLAFDALAVTVSAAA